MSLQAMSVRFLDSQGESQFLDALSKIKSPRANKQYTLLGLLMLDAGMRISEAISMQLFQLDVPRKVLQVRSLKKRKEKAIYRTVPMTDRILEALTDWWVYLKSKTPEDYLFPARSSKNQAAHINRKVVWRVFKNITDSKVHPHLLRHTFCTNLAASGADAYVIKELAGHESARTSEIYIHVGQRKKEMAIARIDRTKWWLRMYRKIVPRDKVAIIAMPGGPLDIHIGRTDELAQLVDLADKKVNTLLLGAQGMGKTHILNNIQAGGSLGKVLRIDDMQGIKKTLQGMVIAVFEGNPDNIRDEDGNLLDDGGKQALKEMLYGTDAELDKILTKESTKQLAELLIKITQRHEYTIIIDDATRITPTGVSILEKLNDHFHMVIAARNIKFNQISFLSNFQKIDLQPLTRSETIEMIIRASEDFRDRIEDFEMFKNHVERTTGGNPKYILELIDRFRKEPAVTPELLHSISHTTALREWDMSLVVLILLSSLMVLRYIGGEMGDDSGAFKLIGGIFLVFALFARNLLNLGKRKFV